MPFHHVVVTLGESDKCLFSDLSEKDLRKRFVKPYRRGRKILSGNEVIDVSAIKKLHVIRTERTSEEERHDLNERSLRRTEEFNRTSRYLLIAPMGDGHSPEDVVKCGTDVTAEYISGPPGDLTARLTDPWVLGIGLAVIGAVVTWLSGLLNAP